MKNNEERSEIENKVVNSRSTFFYNPMQGIQDPSSQNFSQLLGQPQIKYMVPNFQRDYSWDKDQWSDLWQDIQSILKGKDAEHYMGYLVLQPKTENSVIEIIDGQQRIATLTVLLLAIIKRLDDLINAKVEEELNQFRKDELKNTFIGIRKLQTGRTENKLSLNRNNNEFFKTYILEGHTAPKRIKSSNKLLNESFAWFYSQLSDYAHGNELIDISTTITTKLFFSVLRVEGDVNAFKVFETLNARGIELSSTDLLKNYLFQIADKEGTESDLTEMDDLWNEITAKLGNKDIVDFIRAYWNGRYELTRTGELFRVIREKIKTKVEAFDFIQNLYLLADAYNAIVDPYSDLWDGNQGIIQPLLELKMYRKKQHIPAILVAYEKIFEVDKSSFTRLLSACSVASFRRNVISQLNPNTEEQFYNNLAMGIYKTGSFDINKFKDIYIEDTAFKPAFMAKEYESETSKICRYILCALESPASDYNSTKLTLEHIIPHKDHTHWQNIQHPDEFVYKIGNLILLEKKLQKSAGIASASIKLAVYKQSTISATKEIGNKQDWGINDIEERINKLADKACITWSINFPN